MYFAKQQRRFWAKLRYGLAHGISHHTLRMLKKTTVVSF